MSDDFQYEVFLSHSAKDKAVVCDVAERLREDGVKVLFDEWVLKLGDSIPAKIEERLERSCMPVHRISANAFGSDWAQVESSTFRLSDHLNRERRFLPDASRPPSKAPPRQFARRRPASRRLQIQLRQAGLEVCSVST